MHYYGPEKVVQGEGTILLVGNRNVGKSVIFKLLTGRYVTVFNHPGTTVEITRGIASLRGRERVVSNCTGGGLDGR
jgi:ferrous iron transport protein B